VNGDNVFHGLVAVHKAALLWARRYCRLFVSDSTYKTNKYEWTMHHIGGFTAQNKNVTFGYMLMPKNEQKEADYTWAFTMLSEILWDDDNKPPGVWVTDRELAVNLAIKAVLPDTALMLCTWHIDNDVKVQAW
jgi:hypothetical protein